MATELDLESEVVLTDVLGRLASRDLGALACVSRAFRDRLQRPDAWAPALRRAASAAPALAALQRAGPAPRDALRRLEAFLEVDHCRWRQAAAGSGSGPAPREGAGGCAWRGALAVFGGWSAHGLADDLLLAEEGGLWRGPLRFAGERPRPVYGATVLACGARDERLLVAGGLHFGGYVGETGSTHLLEPVKNGEDAADRELSEGSHVWREVHPGGLVPRGYPSLAASNGGMSVWAFGGIRDGASCAVLQVLDVAEGTWSPPLETDGDCPCARFGHSAAVWGNALYIFGGGTGGDLLREGVDLTDIHRLDLGALRWTRLDAGEPPHPRACGRCHTGTLAGDKVVFFGGSLDQTDAVMWFDLRAGKWGAPEVRGAELPVERFSHVAALVGTRVFVFSGWCSYTYGNILADLWQLDLADIDAPDAAGEAAPSEARGGRGATARIVRMLVHSLGRTLPGSFLARVENALSRFTAHRDSGDAGEEEDGELAEIEDEIHDLISQAAQLHADADDDSEDEDDFSDSSSGGAGPAGDDWEPSSSSEPGDEDSEESA